MKNIFRSIFLFIVGTALNMVPFGLVFNLVITFCRMWDILWLAWILIFIFYIGVLNATFYALHRSQKRYASTLPRDKCISVKEDFILFVKQEGIVVLIMYIVTISLQIFVFDFHKGYHYFELFFALPAALANFKNDWVNLAVCVLSFAVCYSGLAVLIRRKIRKNRYDFLFKDNGEAIEKE